MGTHLGFAALVHAAVILALWSVKASDAERERYKQALQREAMARNQKVTDWVNAVGDVNLEPSELTYGDLKALLHGPGKPWFPMWGENVLNLDWYGCVDVGFMCAGTPSDSDRPVGILIRRPVSRLSSWCSCGGITQSAAAKGFPENAGAREHVFGGHWTGLCTGAQGAVTMAQARDTHYTYSVHYRAPGER